MIPWLRSQLTLHSDGAVDSHRENDGVSKMKKFIRWTHLVREVLFLLLTLMKVIEAVHELADKVVNCHARKLQVLLPA